MKAQRQSKKPSEKDRNEGITGIGVKGFKSLDRRSEIQIRPLTILAGTNSSGKSSIMQPMLLMKQTLEAGYDPGPLLLNGPNATFTSFNQFISISQKGSEFQTFSVQIEYVDKWLKVVFALTDRQHLRIRNMTIGAGDRTFQMTPEQTAEDLRKAILRFVPKKNRWFSPPKGMQWMVIRDRCFLDITMGITRGNGEPESIRAPKPGILSALLDPQLYTNTDEELHRMIHVPGFRGSPERAYPITTSGPEFPGTFEKYVATIISDWQAQRDRRVRLLAELLADLGLTWKVSAESVDHTRIELQVGRLPKPERADDLVSIADVGFGVSQVLPVLVAILVAEPGQLVYLEQPELHLHPRAQYRLARIFADAAGRGVKLIVETHSALLLRSLQTLVAKQYLEPEFAILHWFTRNGDGSTSIHSADMDEIGAFGDWPEDFGEVEMAAEGAYLDAVEQRIRR